MEDSKSVLVIEDNSEIRNVIVTFLEISGFTVNSCENGLKGLEAFKKLKTDYVITDIKMPGELDGIEIVRRIKAYRPKTKIFVCTGFAENLESIENMAHKILEKPLNLQFLKKCLDDAS
ncbi:MAG: hypothetical protein COA79_06250 [Planctomycetota bacterium]|nr:MAG: hypothetical protein COA79_06250 [Planctomycetota bacterium]